MARAERSRRSEHDRLRLGVEVERLLAVLLAVAAGLPAAERELVVHLGPGVDPRVARLDAPGGLACAREISRPHRGAETELRGVRACDRLVEVGDAPDRKSGPEHLLGRHGRVVGWVDDDGGRVEEAVRELGIVWSGAAGEKLATGAHGLRDLARDLGALRIGVHRTHLRPPGVAAPD